MGLHIVPGMDSYYEPDDDPHEECLTTEDAVLAFTGGLQAMRETLARLAEQGGHPEIAASMRATWYPSWGADPGKPEKIANDCWEALRF